MSCSHHSKEELEEELSKQRAFMSQLVGKLPPRYPAGRLNAEDQGELTYAVAADLAKAG
jgi:hypothetical protein